MCLCLSLLYFGLNAAYLIQHDGAFKTTFCGLFYDFKSDE